MPKSLKELLDDRNKLIEQDRKLLGDDSKSNSDKCVESDKLNADIEVLDKEIEQARSVDAKLARAEANKAKLGQEPERRIPTEVPAAAAKVVAKLGRHEMSLDPSHRLSPRVSNDYLEAFDKYLAFGGSANEEKLGVMVTKDDKGGYAVPVQMANQLVKFVDDNVFMRQIATVLPPIMDAVSLGAVSYDADPSDGDWTAEVPASDISEDDSISFGKRELKPNLLTKLIKASDKFLRQASHLPGGATNFLGSRLGYKFGISMEKGYLSGSGVQQPLGVFTASNDGVPTTQDFTCSSTTAFSADDIINSFYTLKPQYQARATGLFSRTFVKKARTLKDGTGQYLWQAGLVAGQPDRILGRPYVQSEYVPSTYTTGLYVGMWADFSWYWIVDCLAMSIQRLAELFALRNQQGFVARLETDGMPVLAEAFVRLKLA